MFGFFILKWFLVLKRGGGEVSQTVGGVVSGTGQTLGLTLQYVTNGISGLNDSEYGLLGNVTAPTLNEVPV